MRRLRIVPADGPAFVDQLRAAWDAGDAVLPLDSRLPRPAAEAVVAAARPGDPVDPGDAVVVATSGSTGEPKLAVLTHDAVAASALATSARLGVDPTGDRWLACLPLAHIGGLAVVTRALVTGTPLEVHAGFEAAAVADAARRGATLVALVATALARIDPAAFRRVVLGGSAPPAGLPANVVTTYGLTESGSGVVYDGVPLDGVAVSVAPGPHAAAEVHVRGPMLLRCYRDGTDPKDGDGWLATGDAGAVDEAGRLTVFGRAGDAIVTGGENVWPAPVEDVLLTHPAVADVAVVGRPDPTWGERVVAVVVAADAADPPGLDALRRHVKEVLPAWCAPRALELVDHLPRTAVGKVRRAEL